MGSAILARSGFGLLMVALYCYIMLIGPIREMFTDGTVFTETYQKINGNILPYFLIQDQRVLFFRTVFNCGYC